jgi:Mg2+ and Co2+ transporter CorA
MWGRLRPSFRPFRAKNEAAHDGASPAAASGGHGALAPEAMQPDPYLDELQVKVDKCEEMVHHLNELFSEVEDQLTATARTCRDVDDEIETLGSRLKTRTQEIEHKLTKAMEEERREMVAIVDGRLDKLNLKLKANEHVLQHLKQGEQENADVLESATEWLREVGEQHRQLSEYLRHAGELEERTLAPLHSTSWSNSLLTALGGNDGGGQSSLLRALVLISVFVILVSYVTAIFVQRMSPAAAAESSHGGD